MSTIAGDPVWTEDVELADDGDDAVGTTWIGFQHVANRSRFLRGTIPHAIANLEEVDSHNDDVILDVCFAPGITLSGAAVGGFLAVGYVLAGGLSAVIRSAYDGKAWARSPNATFNGYMLGVAHGGSGALGSRRVVYVGMDAVGRPLIATAEDAAVGSLTMRTVPAAFASLAARLVGVKWNGAVWCAAGHRASGVTALCTAPSAGDVWTQQTPGDSYAGNFTKVHVHGTSIILIGENGEVQVSTNNGATFNRHYSDPTLGTLTSIVSISDNCLIITTSVAGRLLQSVNGGINWSEITLPAVPDMAGAVAEHAFALGGVAGLSMAVAGDPRRAIIASYDGGATWPGRARVAAPIRPYVASAIDGTRLVVAAADEAGTFSSLYATPRTLGS